MVVLGKQLADLAERLGDHVENRACGSLWYFLGQACNHDTRS